jgi:ABC-type sugar transport system permease subunit
MKFRRLPRWSMAAPSLGWWTFFFIVPTFWIALYSLGTKPPPGGGAVSLDVISLGNYSAVVTELFLRVFWITLHTAGLGTIACLLVGFPVAYALAYYVPARWRAGLLFLLVLPYWTSFLLRTFAWRIILAPEGWLSQTLRQEHAADRCSTPMRPSSPASPITTAADGTHIGALIASIRPGHASMTGRGWLHVPVGDAVLAATEPRRRVSLSWRPATTWCWRSLAGQG